MCILTIVHILTLILKIKKINPKFNPKTVDHRTIILKHENMFAKCYTPNWSQEVFIIKNVKYCTVDKCNKRF